MTRKKVLVLDLDHTLIHTFVEPTVNEDFGQFSVRPGFEAFIECVQPFYEIHLFTAATEGYAKPLLQYLDSDGTIFESALYNDSCTYTTKDWFIKDITKIHDDLSNVVLVDDDPEATSWDQACNHIHIREYLDKNRDTDMELAILTDFLLEIKDSDDLSREVPHWKPFRKTFGDITTDNKPK